MPYKKTMHKRRRMNHKRTRKQRGGERGTGVYGLGFGPIGDDAVSGKVDLRVPLDTCDTPHPHPLQNAMVGGSRGYGIVEPQGALDQTVVGGSGYPIIEPNTSGCFAMEQLSPEGLVGGKKRSRRNRRRRNKRNAHKTSRRSTGKRGRKGKRSRK